MRLEFSETRRSGGGLRSSPPWSGGLGRRICGDWRGLGCRISGDRIRSARRCAAEPVGGSEVASGPGTSSSCATGTTAAAGGGAGMGAAAETSALGAVAARWLDRRQRSTSTAPVAKRSRTTTATQIGKPCDGSSYRWPARRRRVDAGAVGERAGPPMAGCAARLGHRSGEAEGQGRRRADVERCRARFGGVEGELRPGERTRGDLEGPRGERGRDEERVGGVEEAVVGVALAGRVAGVADCGGGRVPPDGVKASMLAGNGVVAPR